MGLQQPTSNAPTHGSELARMAAALEEQNSLTKHEQELRAREIEANVQLALSKAAEAQASLARTTALERELTQREAIMGECQNLQIGVRHLTAELTEAMKHGAVRKQLGEIHQNLERVLGLIQSLVVCLTHALSDDDSQVARQQLKEIQQQLVDLFGKSVSAPAIGVVRSDRDTNIKG